MTSIKKILPWSKNKRKDRKNFFVYRLKLHGMSSDEIYDIEGPLMELALKFFPKNQDKQADFLACMAEMIVTSFEAGYPWGEIPKDYMVHLARLWKVEFAFVSQLSTQGEDWWKEFLV